MPKKGQVTIFIIVGLIILMVFLFLIAFSNKLKKSELQQEQEQIVTGIIKKEALRLYVEDCLKDELEEGLILLGKQGRLWLGQPGGRKAFQEGITGITYPPQEGEEIFYGITNEQYEQEAAYPCQDEENPPQYCRYSYPDTEIGFGKLEFNANSFADDLKRFLINRTIFCVENYTKTNLSSSAEITSTEMDLNLEIRNDGISVLAIYPLSFTVGQEDFFQLSEFSFFYETPLKQFLDAAIVFPFRFDQKYLDFDYADEVNQEQFDYGSQITGSNCDDVQGENYFLCRRNAFSDVFSRLGIYFEQRPLANGDDLFVFDILNILQGQEDPYQFRLARQNRPPALDYVNRSACPDGGYDYLAVPNDDEWGEINISLFALDPDEDEVNHDFSAPPGFSPTEQEGNNFSINKINLIDLTPGTYQLIATASDGYLTDQQTVRVLVDRPLQTNLELAMPYDILLANGETLPYAEFSQLVEEKFVSREDPVVLEVTFPQSTSSEDDRASEEVVLIYFDGIHEYVFLSPATLNPNGVITTQITLPQNDHPPYPNQEEAIISIGDANFFDIHPFIELTNNGKLILEYSLNYCDEHLKTSFSEVDLSVKECVPHKNLQHPYPYMGGTDFYKYEYSLDEEGNINYAGGYTLIEDFDPFLASHSCCKSDWTIRNSGEVCFTNPTPGCYGQNPEFRVPPGYILEEQFATCDGLRGNVCGGRQSRFVNNQLRCGINELSTCYNIEEACQEQDAYSYVTLEDNSKGWCYGTMGCQDVCTSVVVDNREFAFVGEEDLNLNQLALDNQAINHHGLGFGCGCNANNIGQPCDTNFDNHFNGVCDSMEGKESPDYFCDGDSP
ncbi:MAG: hypothetical protein KKH52_00160 [Nanoarchaeota archaeon]|nr:hypothetical protein [Nanoarchaeota archaeon]MBU1973789.1 hypothetical protein [Nanoarchaeota archaeon]